LHRAGVANTAPAVGAGIRLMIQQRAVLQIGKRIGEVMETEGLISALEDTIAFLRNSQASDWAHRSVGEIVQELEAEIVKIKISQPIDAKLLGFLFAPTGAIQETSIDNGWGKDFLRISEIVDEFTVDR